MRETKNSLRYSIENEEWDEIARIALTFQVEMSREDKETSKLRKEMNLVKQIIYENMKTPEMAEKFLNAAFFVRMVRVVEKLEKKFDDNQLKKNEFLMFLKALLQKLKKERLVVYKTLERKNEFKRLKDVGLP